MPGLDYFASGAPMVLIVAIRLSLAGTVAPALRRTRMLRMDLDHSRMTQVLNNLISNASKFSPFGSTVTVNMQPLDESVQIDVIDEGAGIDPAEAEAVFDPFYRIEDESVKKVPGTGLGLHVARTIVRQHGGDITIVKGNTSGTTLRVALPIVRDD